MYDVPCNVYLSTLNEQQKIHTMMMIGNIKLYTNAINYYAMNYCTSIGENKNKKKEKKNVCKKKTTEMQHAQLKLAIITT